MHSRLLKKAGILTYLLLLLGCTKEVANEQPIERDVSRNALTVFVVRHAEAYKNLTHPAEMSKEKLDSLTSKGIRQAIAVGRLLEDEGVVAVITSPTTRTRQTAEAIARGIGLTNPPDVDVAFSSLERGKTPDGESVSWFWREKQWQAGHDPRPQGGESLKDGMDRAGHAIEELARRHPGKAVVIVTHGDICVALIGKAARTPLVECYLKHIVPLGSTSEISVSTQDWTLKSHGVVSREAKSP